MGYASGNDNDIAWTYIMNHTTFTPQLNSGRSAINPKHFVGSAVVVVKWVNAVTPTTIPAIRGKELLKNRRWVMSCQFHRQSIQDQGESAVRKNAIILQRLQKHIRFAGRF